MSKVHRDFNGHTYTDVPVAQIFIPEYQRDELDRWVSELGENWNPGLFRPPTLSHMADGRYACIDGQHTVAAAIRRGHQTIPALVYEHKSDAEDAARFSDLNTQRRKPEAYDVWVADYAAGREWAVTIHTLADKYGLRPTKGGDGPRNLRAIGAMRTIINTGRTPELDDALDILTSVYDADGSYNRSRIERNFIIGMVDLIARAQTFKAYDKDVFKRKLGRASYRFNGASVPVTPDGFQSYLNTLIQQGQVVVPTMNSGSGQARVYGRALAHAILSRDLANKVYG